MKALGSRLVVISAILFLLFAYTNCGSGFTAASLNVNAVGLNAGGGTTGGSTGGGTGGDGSGYTNQNIVPVSTGTCAYVNAPCVSVTICVPGTTSCHTVDNVLVDTGSVGLRVFKSALGVSLTNLANSGGTPYAECQGYVGGSSDWGPIALADIQMGGEKATSVPMQIIDSTFLNPPSSCANLDTDPDSVGFNGILGVGTFVQDCGSACADQSGLGIYYTCTAATCSGAAVPLAYQLTNPVSKMPLDNNGVIIQMPAIAASGASSAVGTMYLGIGTQANNTLSGLSVLPIDNYGNFTTVFDGKSYSNSFIDSGSNAYFFPQPAASLATCTGATYFYCPPSTRTFSATMISADGTATKAVSFSVFNATPLLSNSSTIVAASQLGGSMDGNFDWGFSFFFGRTVVTSIEGKATNLGTGPYWAF